MSFHARNLSVTLMAAVSGLALSIFLAPAFAQTQDSPERNRYNANGMPTTHSTPSGQAETARINRQVGADNRAIDDRSNANDARYLAERNQYQGQRSQYEGQLQNNGAQRSEYDRRGDRGPTISYYGQGYDVAPDENDYWNVESYTDFGADYRHIWTSINRARERGSLSPYEARRFSQRLQRIQYRADAQQRRGRFDAQDIEYQLGQLRDDMRSARRSNRDEQNYNRR